MVAAGRAFGAREPDESVRNPDWLAERFLSREELDLIREHPIAPALERDYQQARQNPEVAGLSNFMLVRTRDNDSFNRLHAEQLLHLPGVRQIRSFIVLKQVLSTTRIPI